MGGAVAQAEQQVDALTEDLRRELDGVRTDMAVLQRSGSNQSLNPKKKKKKKKKPKKKKKRNKPKKKSKTKAKKNSGPYELPSIELLDERPANTSGTDSSSLTEKAEKIEQALESFGVLGTRVVKILPGPTVTGAPSRCAC